MLFTKVRDRLRKEKSDIELEQNKSMGTLEHKVDVEFVAESIDHVADPKAFDSLRTLERLDFSLSCQQQSRSSSDLCYISNAISPSGADILVSDIEANPWTKLRTRMLQLYDSRESFIPSLKTLVETLEKSNLIDFCPNHVLVNKYEPCQGIMHHEDGPVYHPSVVIISLGESTVFSFRKKVKEMTRGISPQREVSENENENENENGTVMETTSLVLRPRSMLLFSGEYYKNQLHGIHETSSQIILPSCVNACKADAIIGDIIERQDTRISITIRQKLY
jgi:alkylated DNA repair protein alkB homolog 6